MNARRSQALEPEPRGVLAVAQAAADPLTTAVGRAVVAVPGDASDKVQLSTASML